MTLYNHAFDIAFSLQATAEDSDDVTGVELLAALKARVAYLEKHPSEIIEACGKAFDSYEVIKPNIAEGETFFESSGIRRKAIVVAEPGAGNVLRIMIDKCSLAPDVFVDIGTMHAMDDYLHENRPLLDEIHHHLRMAGYEGESLTALDREFQESGRIILESGEAFDDFAKSIGWIDLGERDSEIRDGLAGMTTDELTAEIRRLKLDANARVSIRAFADGKISEPRHRRELIDIVARDALRAFKNRFDNQFQKKSTP